jgi:hypothetical protein
VRANTRREYRRLLINFALTYFDREVRVRDPDRAAVQHFVDWLTTRPGRDGRLCDRSIAIRQVYLHYDSYTKRELARVAKELPGAARRRHAGRPRERSRCADRH